MNYKQSTFMLSVVAIFLGLLFMAGGILQRGTIEFDGSWLFMILSPVAIVGWYKSEKKEYYYKKAMRK